MVTRSWSSGERVNIRNKCAAGSSPSVRVQYTSFLHRGETPLTPPFALLADPSGGPFQGTLLGDPSGGPFRGSLPAGPPELGGAYAFYFITRQLF